LIAMPSGEARVVVTTDGKVRVGFPSKRIPRASPEGMA
jgi:hypothetical protein